LIPTMPLERRKKRARKSINSAPTGAENNIELSGAPPTRKTILSFLCTTLLFEPDVDSAETMCAAHFCISKDAVHDNYMKGHTIFEMTYIDENAVDTVQPGDLRISPNTLIGAIHALNKKISYCDQRESVNSKKILELESSLAIAHFDVQNSTDDGYRMGFLEGKKAIRSANDDQQAKLNTIINENWLGKLITTMLKYDD